MLQRGDVAFMNCNAVSDKPINSIGDDQIKRNILLFVLFIVLLSTLGTTTAHKADATILTGSGYTTGINEGYYVHYSFINYCPLCYHSNCLERGLKRYDEISCRKCKADYSFSGKDKSYNPRAWLIVYVPEPEPVVSKVETVQPGPSPWEKAQACYVSNRIF